MFTSCCYIHRSSSGNGNWMYSARTRTEEEEQNVRQKFTSVDIGLQVGKGHGAMVMVYEIRWFEFPLIKDLDHDNIECGAYCELLHFRLWKAF